MSTADRLRNGILIDKHKSDTIRESARNSVWSRIAKLEKKELCLECERRKWKTRSIQVCSECAKRKSTLTCCHCKVSYVNHRFCAKAAQIYKRELCMACAANWATYNCDPKLCRLCNQWSAWRPTSECDTCYNFLRKYGEPSQCETCSNQAAFDRGESARQKVNNLKLCFLCTYNYKKNDYYNRKLMMSISNDPSGSKNEEKSSKKNSPRSPREVQGSGDSDQLRPAGESSRMESERNEALIKENVALKQSLQNLTKKYAELQEEIIQLNKKLKAR